MQGAWQSAPTGANRDTTLGKLDWRLPNIKELMSLAEHCGSDSAINIVVFPSDAFCSSTTVNATRTKAWIFGTTNGEAGGALKTATALLFAPLARGGHTANTYDANTALLCNAHIEGNGEIGGLTDGLLLMHGSTKLPKHELTRLHSG